MKLLYQFLIVGSFILFYMESKAQNTAKPGNIAVEHGIFIYTGSELPKNAAYIIERKEEKNKKYQEIAKTTTPKSLEELTNNAKTAETYFKNLAPLTNKDLKRIYNYIQTYKVDDSLYRAENLPIIAIASGTGFLDMDVEKDKTYQYKVTFFRDGTEVSQQELKAIKNTVITNLPVPKKFKSDVVNQAVFLEWIVDEQKEISLFNTYRAYFGTLDFKKINAKKGYSNSEDGLHLIAVDSTTEKSSLYKYYIQPVDLYGNAGEVSEVISAGKLQSESIEPISSINAEELTDYQVKISWKLDKSVIRSNIKVMRSNTYDDGYVEVMNLPPNTLEYIDNLPEASENYYYYLVINGGTGQEFKTAKIAAMVKTNTKELTPPQDLSGTSIKDGIEISWNHSEPYTHGFYVYRATADAETFHQISNLIPVKPEENYTYKDLDKTLMAGEMYRYTVRAENDAYTLGKFSDTIHAFSGKKPKIEAPQKLKSVFRDSIVELYWEDMTTLSDNVLGYKVYRNNDNNSTMVLLKNDTLKSYKNYYNDSTISKGQSYSYQVATLDMFGQESELSLPTNITIPEDSKKSMTPSKPIVYKNSQGITISWNQIASEDIMEIKIYRSNGKAQPKAIKTLPVNDEKYIDTSVKNGQLYYYKISFIFKNGNESEASREVSINF
ncbi:MAG: hypothetical protein R2816_00675 [Flavobacteriaceae bacterium]